MKDDYHIPVMLQETVSFLRVRPGKWYVDCNLGGGGHTEGILRSGGKVIGIDLDQEAIREVAKKYQLQLEEKEQRLQAFSENLIICQENFTNLKQVITRFSLNGIYGVLFDLGVSSHQLEEAGRGFSLNVEAPLDMRMDQIHMSVTAADLVNGLHERELAQLFWKLGEERFSRPIARQIAEYRQKKKIETTNELAGIILSVKSKSKVDRTHPATRVFQALRIAVNDELNSLKEVLPQAVDILQPGGRLVVISFHSLEDRIVKNFFQDQEKLRAVVAVTKKPIIPTVFEVNLNPRSRSGKLRVAEKVASNSR